MSTTVRLPAAILQRLAEFSAERASGTVLLRFEAGRILDATITRRYPGHVGSARRAGSIDAREIIATEQRARR